MSRRANPPKAFQTPVRAHKCILNELLPFGAAADKPNRKRECAVFMPFDEHAIGAHVAGENLFNDLPISVNDGCHGHFFRLHPARECFTTSGTV